MLQIGLMKTLTSKIESQTSNSYRISRAGSQRKLIGRKIWEKRFRIEKRRGQPPSFTVRHKIRRKDKIYRNRERSSPEAKGGWDN